MDFSGEIRIICLCRVIGWDSDKDAFECEKPNGVAQPIVILSAAEQEAHTFWVLFHCVSCR